MVKTRNVRRISMPPRDSEKIPLQFVGAFDNWIASLKS
jgi:hypothetical protein